MGSNVKVCVAPRPQSRTPAPHQLLELENTAGDRKSARLDGHRDEYRTRDGRLPYPFKGEGGVFVLTSEAVERFDHPGLYMVLRGEPGAKAATEQPAPVFGHATRRSPRRGQAQDMELRRYCAGCAREAEHVPWATGGPVQIPAIQWPGAEPASGTTICLDCGQLRAAAFPPSPPAWSSWSSNPGALPAGRDGALTEAENREGR